MRHKNDGYRGISDGYRIYSEILHFSFVLDICHFLYIRSILAGTNLDGYRGLPVSTNE